MVPSNYTGNLISLIAMNPLTGLPNSLREPHNRVLSRRQEFTDCNVVSSYCRYNAHSSPSPGETMIRKEEKNQLVDA